VIVTLLAMSPFSIEILTSAMGQKQPLNQFRLWLFSSIIVG